MRVHEVLTDSTSHLSSHGKGGGCSGGNDSSGVFGVGSSMRLGEFEGGQISGGFITVRQPWVRVNQKMTHVLKELGYCLKNDR